METPGEDGPLTLAIDVGTTAVKLLLLNRGGAWTLSHHATDLEDLWGPVKAAVAPHAFRIERVGITGQGQSALLVRDGERVGELQTWNDPLDVAEVDLPDGAVLRRGGGWLPRRLRRWALDHPEETDVVSLQLKDWLNFQLTGVLASDARSMRGLLDREGRMPEDLGAWVGLGDVVPPLHPPEAVIGRVHGAGAARSGLRPGTEVICGCDDLSAGVAGLSPEPGRRFNLANTSEHLGVIPVDCEGIIDHARATGLSFLPACGVLPALLYSATSTGAANLLDEGITTLPEAPPDMAGVPAYDPHLAGRRGLAPDPAHSGGWSGPVDDVSLDARAWRILEALSEALDPIDDALQAWNDGRPLLIGGGLAESRAFITFRHAERGAGREVSALGVARLAQRRPRGVIFGAGKVGRGFLAQMLARSGWDVSLVDVSVPLLEALEPGWVVHNLATGEEEVLHADLHPLDGDLFKVLETADLVLTSIGASHLEAWARRVREPLCQRLSEGDLDLILAENHPRPAAAVREALLGGALADEAALIDAHLGISQAQVLRSCIEPTPAQASTTVQVQDHWTLPLDGDALRTDPVVQGFEPKPDFARELTRKLFTYNCVNAVVCYVGHLRGHVWLADAANDEAIAELARRAGAESSAALVAAFGFDAEDQARWCRRALAKYRDRAIRDPIERNARDPVRKLGEEERLLGPLRLCEAHGLPADALRIGIAAALRYPGAPALEIGGRDSADAALDRLLAGEPI